MSVTIREPGSAITHFIGMMMAILASTPLLIKAVLSGQPVIFFAMVVFIASMILLYGASATYHSINAGGRILRSTLFRRQSCCDRLHEGPCKGTGAVPHPGQLYRSGRDRHGDERPVGRRDPGSPTGGNASGTARFPDPHCGRRPVSRLRPRIIHHWPGPGRERWHGYLKGKAA